MKKELNRKEFLQRLGIYGITAFGASAFLAACGGGGNKDQPQVQGDMDSDASNKSSDPCTDVSGLTDAELKNRQNLKYVGKSPYSDKYCANCNFFIAPQNGAQCGTCQVVKGPINPQGHCTAWVAKQKS